MNLFDLLHTWDLAILRFANTDLARPINDFVLRAWSSELPWITLAVFFFAQTAYRRQWFAFKTLLWMGGTVGLADIVAAQLIKPWVGRLRPCKMEELVRVVDGCAGSLSFPSNHSANAAAFCVFWLLWKGPRSGLLALACMAMVGFSRIYLGNHYPSDVLGGFLLGTLLALLSYGLYRRILVPHDPEKIAKKGQTAEV